MRVEEIFILIAATVLVFIPALAVTARFALRPIVEAIIRLREGFLGTPNTSALDARLAAIENQLVDMRAEMARLAEVREFDRALKESHHVELPAPSGGNALAASPPPTTS